MSRTTQKTRLQRDILIMAYDYPDMSQKEIAEYLGCSSSYVSQVLRKYDDQRAMRARIEGFNQDLGIAPMDFDLGFTDSPRQSDYDDINIEELGPIGIVIVAAVIGGIFLFMNPLQNIFSWYIRWVIVAICVVGILGIGAMFHTKYQQNGLVHATKWFFAPFESESRKHSSNSGSSNTKTTPPAPENLKNKLYFERANQKCEWCDTHVDSPDVHHIKPRSKGGPNDPENLIVLCPNCHRKADNGVISKSKLRYKLKNYT